MPKNHLFLQGQNHICEYRSLLTVACTQNIKRLNNLHIKVGRYLRITNLFQ